MSKPVTTKSLDTEMKVVWTIPGVGDVERSTLITYGLIILSTIGTFIYAVVFTSSQTSDIPDTRGTQRRNRDINDTMVDLLGTNWLAVVVVFYIMALLLVMSIYMLNICSSVNLDVGTPDTSKYFVWGIYGLVALIMIGQLVQAGWYYVNDYNFSSDTLVSTRKSQVKKRTEDVTAIALLILGLVLLVVSVAVFRYVFFKG
jgi:hypothetical protein